MELLLKFIEQVDWERFVLSSLRLLLALILLWLVVRVVVSR